MVERQVDQALPDQGEGPSFGALLRRYRERAGLSQNGLARASGVDAGSVNRLESGKREPTARETVRQLIAALGLARAEGDGLLGVAGHLPLAFDGVAPTDPTITLVADLLSDPTISAEHRAEFRLLVALAARRWRPAAALPPLPPAGQPS